MSDGQTDRDAGWSERYAETGGWPPPAAGQRPYEPGATPPPDQTRPPAGAQQPDTTTPGTDPWSQPGTGGYGATRPQTGGYGATGPETGGYGSETGGYGSETGGYGGPPEWEQPPTQWGQQYGPATRWGQPPAGEGTGDGPATPWGQPPARNGWGQPATGHETGADTPSGPPTGAWAPGDSGYGRLTGQTPQQPRQPRQRPRRPWDGRPAPVRRPGRSPVITYTLIAVCVVLYLAQQADPSVTARYALIPVAVQDGQYARLITATFLHASLLHLGTNMITLYIVGTPLERVLGPVRYLTVYLLSALGGSLLSVWLSPEFSIGVGASGAIFGLFGALVVLRRQVGAEAGGLAVLIGLNLVISFTVPNISWQAHIGGLVTGVLVALVMTALDRLRRRPAG